jgi:hypothetical protein
MLEAIKSDFYRPMVFAHTKRLQSCCKLRLWEGIHILFAESLNPMQRNQCNIRLFINVLMRLKPFDVSAHRQREARRCLTSCEARIAAAPAVMLSPFEFKAGSNKFSFSATHE